MKLPQAFFYQDIRRRLGGLGPTGRRLAVLTITVVLCFLVVIPFTKGDRPVKRAAVLPSRTVVAAAPRVPLPAGPTIGEQENAASAKPPVLTTKDFRPPIVGKVLRPTSNGLIWWELLDDYRQHLGTDIQANIGQKVVASASGTVTELGNDPVYGNVLVIEHDGGWQTVYGGLKEVRVRLNQTVKSGQELALIAPPSGAEADLKAHLHYELWHDGKLINTGN